MKKARSKGKPINPAWTVLIHDKLDRLRVPALTQGKPLSPAKILGNRVAIMLSRFTPEQVKESIERVPPPIVVPQNLPPTMNAKQYKAMATTYPEGEGLSLMQILADRIAKGDRDFMMEFSKAMKMQSENTEDRCDLYGVMLTNHIAIDRLKTKKEILEFLEKQVPGCIRGDCNGKNETGVGEENFCKLLGEIGLPRGKG